MHLTFDPAQMRRYSRHILLPDVGGRGQARLLAATVAVDAGTAAARIGAAYLAAAGVSVVLTGPVDAPIAAADARFPLRAADAGHPLGATLAARLAGLNPDVRVTVAAVREADSLALVIDEGDAADGSLAGAMARGAAAAARLVHALAVPS